jgi:hypothetical protein
MAPKNNYISMYIIGYKSYESWDTIIVDYQVVLPFDLHLVFSQFPNAHMSTTFRLTSLNLPG